MGWDQTQEIQQSQTAKLREEDVRTRRILEASDDRYRRLLQVWAARSGEEGKKTCRMKFGGAFEEMFILV